MDVGAHQRSVCLSRAESSIHMGRGCFTRRISASLEGGREQPRGRLALNVMRMPLRTSVSVHTSVHEKPFCSGLAEPCTWPACAPALAFWEAASCPFITFLCPPSPCAHRNACITALNCTYTACRCVTFVLH